MAKFVDKQNLLQYKYFNNLVGNYDIVRDIVSNYMVGEQQLSNRATHNNPKEYWESQRMINRGKRDIPTALYALEEDRQRCHKEIFYGDTRQTRRNAYRYIDILLGINIFQGEQIKRSVEVGQEALEGLSLFFLF